MIKTHFINPVNGKSACGREATGPRLTDNTFLVDCGSCILRNSFQEAHETAKRERRVAFLATPTRRIPEPWRDGHLICPECGSDQFRVGDRTCHGHYQDYECECGHKVSRLTETGMCF